MAFILQKMQKDVLILNRDPVPDMYDFLPGVEKIQTEAPPNLTEFEVVIVLDCGSLERTGVAIPETSLFLNIDHHLNNDRFGRLNWVVPEMSSTAEMIYVVWDALSISMDLSIGYNLYAGILTDTGCFRYSNTTPQCLRIASALVEAGVPPSRIASQIYERKSLSQLLLLGSALSNIMVTQDQKVAYILLSEEVFKIYGATLADAEGLVNYPLTIASVEVALLFKEISKDFFKISFRSKGRVNVAALAESFEGGGHHNAAGAKIRGDFASIWKQMSEMINEQLRNVSIRENGGGGFWKKFF